MLGIPLGLLTANVIEWVAHKYILHARGRHKSSMWSFHWHEHHAASRRHDMLDEDYLRPMFTRHEPLNAQTKEILALVGISLPVLVWAPVAPFFAGTLLYSAWNYYRVHTKAHLDPDWARAHLSWHYDHHMGPDQNANWCVTRPWFDHVMGTRRPYVGTEKELAARAKRRTSSNGLHAVKDSG